MALRASPCDGDHRPAGPARLRNGCMRDATEFDAFYAGSAGRVLGQVFVLTGNRAEAEDAVAEAYTRAWQRWPTVRACDSPEAWVRRVAVRVAVSNWRKAVNQLRAHRRKKPEEPNGELNVDHLALMAALRRIPAAQRQVIVLYHLIGLSVTEISAEVGIPAGTVKTRLARGRRAMADHLSDTDSRGPVVNNG